MCSRKVSIIVVMIGVYMVERNFMKFWISLYL